MGKLKVANLEVKTDSNGMYCLNDLHKASGGEHRHRPSVWLINESTKALELEILKAGIPAIKTTAGRYGGTFVCRELVYAYAMWVSASFNLEVIRVFDKTAQAQSGLQSIAVSVRSATQSLSTQINETSVIIEELKGHGSSWSSYGSQIKKAKREAVKEFEQLKNEIQMKLDLIC